MKANLYSKLLVQMALMIAASSVAQAKTSDISSWSLQDITLSNLDFIASEQISQDSALYQKGEWPTQILSTAIPRVVGVGKMIGYDQEASAFTTASVVNAIATLYLEHPQLRTAKSVQRIPTLIQAAVPTFELYREGDLYNFYPPRLWNGVRVHQPIDMTLAPIWKGFTNIPQDADTTSTVYTALNYDAKINGRPFTVPETVLKSFETFRDLDRKPQFYNKDQKRINTGGFMTWQFDERDMKAPRFWFAAPHKGTRIPFNRNDVDCIVNLNVLRMYAVNRIPFSEGKDQACEMINDMIAKREHAYCGIYYPNTYNLAYSSAELERAGDRCVQEPQRKSTVDFILQNQLVDGGWKNDNNDWIDRVQSTAFAMNALLQFGDRNDPRVHNSLHYGTRFLIQTLRTSKTGDLYWKGELFFTATAIARGLIAWRSSSFTTAAATSALLKMHERYPNKTVQDYLSMH